MEITKCRLCQIGVLSEPKLTLPDTPLANNFLDNPQEQETYPLQICVCEACGHYQLNEQIDPEVLFKHYSFVSGTSPVNVEYFRQYAQEMVDKFNLEPKKDKVLDIGSNDGTLLQHFKYLGFEVLGIDPADKIAQSTINRGINTIATFFTDELASAMRLNGKCYKLITANNVFAHVPDLTDFIRGIKKILAPDGIFSFEVSYFPDVCDKNLFDTIYHEHSSYHTIMPLQMFFQQRDLCIVDVKRITNHGGSIRVYVSHLDNILCERDSIPLSISEDYISCLIQEGQIHQLYEPCMNTKMARLCDKINLLGTELRTTLQSYKDQGKSIAIYGFPAKATTLCSALKIDMNMIDFVVEDASLKIGKYTPFGNKEIFSPYKIIQKRPDVLLILCWNFAESVIQKTKLLLDEHIGDGKYPIFITPLPELKIE